MINQDLISQDLFYKLRGRFTKMQMGDETGKPTFDSKQGRFFNFEAVFEGVNLGTVAISINEPGSLKMYFSQNLVENLTPDIKEHWWKFLKEMRYFAKKRLMSFDPRDIAKTNLDKRDFHYLATKEPNMNESRNVYGTKKTSIRPVSKTKIRIRHSAPVDESIPGARSRNIEAIFIENELGERWKMPYNSLSCAEAMARHVEEGGTPYDDFGRHIQECMGQIAMLHGFKRHVNNHDQMNQEANDIVVKANHKLDSLKEYMRQLSKRQHYHNHKANFQPKEIQPLDQVTFEEYKNAFTTHNFNETLSDVFPLLHSIMSEANELDLEQITMEDGSGGGGGGGSMGGGSMGGTTSSANVASLTKPMEVFRRWAEDITDTGMSPEEIQQLNDLLQEPFQASQALDALADLNFPVDDELKSQIEGVAQATPDADVGDIIKSHIETQDPELYSKLNFAASGADTTTEPEAGAEAPAPEEVPAAEASDANHPEYNKKDDYDLPPSQRGHGTSDYRLPDHKAHDERHKRDFQKRAGTYRSELEDIARLAGRPMEESSEEDEGNWEKTTKAMKKHKEIDNPFALVNWMKNKGYHSHKEGEEEDKLASPGDTAEPEYGKAQTDSEGEESSRQPYDPRAVAQRLYDFYDREKKVFPLGNRGVARKVGKEFEDPAEELAYKLAEKMSPSKPAMRDEFDDIRKLSGIESECDNTNTTFSNAANPTMRLPETGSEVPPTPAKPAPKPRSGDYELDDIWISNPDFNPDDENSSDEIPVTVTFDVSGEYRPATWGYHGGDPAEYPEAEIVSVIDENGNDIYNKLDSRQLDYIQQQVDEYVDQMEPDEPDYDPYDESAQLEDIKRLSGLAK